MSVRTRLLSHLVATIVLALIMLIAAWFWLYT
jgi:hypothetical protein